MFKTGCKVKLKYVHMHNLFEEIEKWHGLDGVDVEDGGVHGLAEDPSATFRHGRGLAGYLVEAPAGGF
jgi:hypothetical protein